MTYIKWRLVIFEYSDSMYRYSYTERVDTISFDSWNQFFPLESNVIMFILWWIYVDKATYSTVKTQSRT